MIGWSTGSVAGVHDGPEDCPPRYLEVSDADAETIAKALRLAADRYEGDAEKFEGFGSFPDKRIARQFRAQAEEARAFAEVLES